MTKTSILFLFCLCSFFQATTQVTYTPFEFERSSWNEQSYNIWFSRSYYDVQVDGDTIIDNVSYYKLRQEGLTYFYDDPSQIEISDSSSFDAYIGAIRETDEKQIEFLFPNNPSPVIIYDFNITTGDTLAIFDRSLGEVTAVVAAMDTVDYCGTMRNRYTLNFPDWLPFPSFWIEGVGSSNGIIPTYELFESAVSLNCFSKENCDCGQIINSINLRPGLRDEFKVYPNPVNQELSIQSNSGIPINTISIFNLYGQQVFETKVNDTSINISCDFLAQGSYFLKLSGTDWHHTQKLLVMH